MDTNDKRFKLLDATMRRHGYQANALIESLHTAQQAYGFLDIEVLRVIARALKLPLSAVYGVATFYNHFTLKPHGEHSCIVCMGTACYIKGAPKLLTAVEEELHIKTGMTTPDGKVSLMQARCFGSCAFAPVVTFDEQLMGHATPESVLGRVKQWTLELESPTGEPQKEGEAKP